MNISGDSDVSTSGSLVYAYCFGPDDRIRQQTVNGVIFQPFGVPSLSQQPVTVGEVTFTNSGPSITPILTDWNTPQFTDLSSAYQGLLSYAIQGYLDTSTLILGGLVEDQPYEVQLWYNQSDTLIGKLTETFELNGASSMLVESNVSGVNGGIGQYITAAFTVAPGSTAVEIVITPGAELTLTTVNAVQVRAVPEPGSMALAAAGALVVAALARRRAGR